MNYTYIYNMIGIYTCGFPAWRIYTISNIFNVQLVRSLSFLTMHIKNKIGEYQNVCHTILYVGLIIILNVSCHLSIMYYTAYNIIYMYYYL